MVDSDAVVEEILDGVYDITWEGREEGHPVTRGYRFRSFLFDFDDDVPTLVDTCYDVGRMVERLLAGIEATGVEPERLIVTHRGPDHAGAVDHVVERYDPTVWVPRDDDLREVDTVDVTTPPDHLYVDGEAIGRFTAVHVPGHSPGNSALVDETAGIAVCGDSLCGSDRRGLPPGYLIHPPASTNRGQPPEAAADAELNLEKLLECDFEVALVFHGSSVFEDAWGKLDRYVNFDAKAGADGSDMHDQSLAVSEYMETLEAYEPE